MGTTTNENSSGPIEEQVAKLAIPPLPAQLDAIPGIRFVDYPDESQLEAVMNLVGRDLSEPYSSKWRLCMCENKNNDIHATTLLCSLQLATHHVTHYKCIQFLYSHIYNNHIKSLYLPLFSLSLSSVMHSGA